MWIFFLTTLFALKGASCYVSSVRMSNSAICVYVDGVKNTCGGHIPSTDDIVFVPTEKDIDLACPGWLDYNRCVNETLDTCPESFEVVIVAKSQTGVLQDLCDKDSKLRSDYLKSSSCYNGFRYYYQYDTECFKNGHVAYEAYENSTMIHLYVFDGRGDKETCFIHGYAYACIAAAVDRVCGEDARSTLLEILTRLKIMDSKCNSYYREEIKNQFFEFLKNEQRAAEPDRNLYLREFYRNLDKDDLTSPVMATAFENL